MFGFLPIYSESLAGWFKHTMSQYLLLSNETRNRTWWIFPPWLTVKKRWSWIAYWLRENILLFSTGRKVNKVSVFYIIRKIKLDLGFAQVFVPRLKRFCTWLWVSLKSRRNKTSDNDNPETKTSPLFKCSEFLEMPGGWGEDTGDIEWENKIRRKGGKKNKLLK